LEVAPKFDFGIYGNKENVQTKDFEAVLRVVAERRQASTVRLDRLAEASVA